MNIPLVRLGLQRVLVRFVVPGQPAGKARARFHSKPTKKGKFAYTPKKTKKEQEAVEIMARRAMAHARRQPVTGPIAVSIQAGYRIPPSWPKKRRELALDQLIYPTVKPDIDNIEKLVLDALKGVAWSDDVCVVDIHTVKFYSPDPHVMIEVREP